MEAFLLSKECFFVFGKKLVVFLWNLLPTCLRMISELCSVIESPMAPRQEITPNASREADARVLNHKERKYGNKNKGGDLKRK